jgi:hypothetical protein
MLGEQDSFRDTINSLSALVANFAQHTDLARMDAILSEVRSASWLLHANWVELGQIACAATQPVVVHSMGNRQT